MPLTYWLASIGIAIALSSPAFATTPWEAWLMNSNAAEAKRVSKITYSDSTSPQKEEVRTTAGLRLLASKVGRADKESFRLAIRLVQTTDGVADLEDIYAMLGRYVRLAPADYLITVSSLQEPHVCAGVAFLGADFADNPGLQKEEIDARRRALESINNPRVNSIRKICLAILQQ